MYSLMEFSISFQLLPPAYVVRREGNVLTRVCPSIHPSVCPQGGTPPGLEGGYPTQVRIRGVPWPGLDGGVPKVGYPLPRQGWGTPPLRFSLRSRRYASCVHAGGLSCSIDIYPWWEKSYEKLMGISSYLHTF